MSEAYEWWPMPKKSEEVDPYLDQLFQYSDNNVWTKLIRSFLKKDLEQRINSGQMGEAQPSKTK